MLHRCRNEGRDPNLERRVAIKTVKVENLSEEAAGDALPLRLAGADRFDVMCQTMQALLDRLTGH